MELTYKPTEEEFIQAQITPRLFMLRIYAALASFLIVFMLLVFLLLGVHDKAAAWWIFFAGIFALVDRYVLVRYRIKRVFRRSPITSSERSVFISGDGIKTVMSNAKEDVQWSAFQKARELKDVLLLYYGPKSYYIFPKRAFTGENLERFRAQLREKGLLT